MNTTYNIYHIKHGNKIRQIESPNNELKLFQKNLIPIFSKYKLLSCCLCVPHKNTLDNANIHKLSKWIFKIDIKDCYKSISFSHLENLLRGDIDLTSNLSHCFITLSGKTFLPTGAPTSPILCNIALSPIDTKLTELASKYGYRYTRYLDDMIFSSVKEPAPNNKITKEILSIVESYGFIINKQKTRLLEKESEPFIITGINVKNNISIPRTMKLQLRSELFKTALNNKDIDKHLSGKLAYVKFIDEYSYNKLIAFYYQRKARYESSRQSSISAQ